MLQINSREFSAGESTGKRQSFVWLKYDTDPFDRTRVLSLKCSICSRFKDRLVGRRNYSSAFVDGSGNLRASSFKDHAASDMHSRAMLLLKKQVRSLGLIANSVYAGLSAGVHGPMPVRSNRSSPEQDGHC